MTEAVAAAGTGIGGWGSLQSFRTYEPLVACRGGGGYGGSYSSKDLGSNLRNINWQEETLLFDVVTSSTAHGPSWHPFVLLL